MTGIREHNLGIIELRVEYKRTQAREKELRQMLMSKNNEIIDARNRTDALRQEIYHLRDMQEQEETRIRKNERLELMLGLRNDVRNMVTMMRAETISDEFKMKMANQLVRKFCRLTGMRPEQFAEDAPDFRRV